MKKVVRKVEREIRFQAARFIAQLLYLAGLTLLLPMFPILFEPELFREVRLIFFVALALIAASFTVIVFVTHSKKRAFSTLGWITLLPGLAAVVFTAFGSDWLIESTMQASPFVQYWIQKYVPNSWFVSGVYVMLGALLLWISEQVRK